MVHTVCKPQAAGSWANILGCITICFSCSYPLLCASTVGSFWESDSEGVGHSVRPRGQGCPWPPVCLITFSRDFVSEDMRSLRLISSQLFFSSLYQNSVQIIPVVILSDGLLVCTKTSHTIHMVLKSTSLFC